MTNNEKTCSIYLRSSDEKIPVIKEEYREFSKGANVRRYRKSAIQNIIGNAWT